MTRRRFVGVAAAVAGALAVPGAGVAPAEDGYALVAAVDRTRILGAAKRYLAEQPVTVTSAHSGRSSGGAHDYFSEGDYWWPDPGNPGGPYIRRDGFSNPANFNAHREALIRLSLMAPALAAAWRLTRAQSYAVHFVKHLRAWFVDPATRMNPNLEYAQAIFGVSKGRGTGIIDTLHLVEVARAARVLEAAGGISPADADAVRAWFAASIATLDARLIARELSLLDIVSLRGGAGAGLREVHERLGAVLLPLLAAGKYLHDVCAFDVKQVSYYGWIPYAASGVGSFLGGWLSSALLRRGPRSIYRGSSARRGRARTALCLCIPWADTNENDIGSYRVAMYCWLGSLG